MVHTRVSTRCGGHRREAASTSCIIGRKVLFPPSVERPEGNLCNLEISRETLSSGESAREESFLPRDGLRAGDFSGQR